MQEQVAKNLLISFACLPINLFWCKKNLVGAIKQYWKPILEQNSILWLFIFFNNACEIVIPWFVCQYTGFFPDYTAIRVYHDGLIFLLFCI